MHPASIAAPVPASAAAPFQIPFPAMVATFCLLWASAFAVAKLAIVDCPPLLLLTMRFLLAGLVVLAAAAASGLKLWLGRRDMLLFAALGVANQAAYLGLSYMGLRTVSSGLSALMISANPVLVAIFATLFLNERMTWRKVVGLVLGVAGVAFVVESRVAGGTEHAAGIAFTLVGVFALVAGTILFKRVSPRGGFWVGNGVQSLAAGIATLPFALTFENVRDIVPTWSLAAALAYLVLGVSVFAYVIWFRMLTVWGATAASAYHFIMPPLGLVFGWLLIGEHVTRSDLLGIVPVALGIYLVTRPAPAA